jgi:hypothetical protein
MPASQSVDGDRNFNHFGNNLLSWRFDYLNIAGQGTGPGLEA